MLPLRTTLRINAVSSGATGILLVFLANPIADLFGVTGMVPFIGTGIFLVLFAVYVFMASVKRDMDQKAIRFIITLDVTWVIASLILVLFFNAALSAIGNLAVIAVALWVAGMAFLQIKGLKVLNAGA